MAMGASLAQAQICTREYAPVCGLAPGQSTPQTFSNSCTLTVARGKEVAKGACPGDGLPLAGGDSDSHGCKGSAGYQWSQELSSCIRPWMSRAVTLEVAARRRTCTGLFEKQCLVVREIPEKGGKKSGQASSKWSPMFDEIAGFTQAPGKRYKIRVRKDRLENPPMDASDTSYTLLRVLE
jgi:hypothetical protein